jgi:hypothetical protein
MNVSLDIALTATPQSLPTLVAARLTALNYPALLKKHFRIVKFEADIANAGTITGRRGSSTAGPYFQIKNGDVERALSSVSYGDESIEGVWVSSDAAPANDILNLTLQD